MGNTGLNFVMIVRTFEIAIVAILAIVVFVIAWRAVCYLRDFRSSSKGGQATASNSDDQLSHMLKRPTKDVVVLATSTKPLMITTLKNKPDHDLAVEKDAFISGLAARNDFFKRVLTKR